MGETKHDGLAVPGRVVLAHELPFTIGKLRVHPATRQVEAHGDQETVEPRVMQVFVALARANGTIVTRDELIECCWDGRIVTDDAINRVLSRIRQLGSVIGRGSFNVETVTKVGYRLVAGTLHGRPRASSPRPLLRGRPPIERRAMILGGAAAAAGIVAGVLLWKPPWRHIPPAEAERLYKAGVRVAREGLPGQVRQSMSYFERAVAIDPDYADAWGALALCYSHLLEGFDEAELASLPGRIRAAAARSLELDPENADAQLALIFITPSFRHWSAKEADLRRVVADHPRHWLAHGRLGVLLYQLGRLSEGIEQHRLALDIEPMLPTAYNFIIRNLSALGKVQEADAMADKARELWPAHPALWVARFNHLLFSGRPRAAAAFVMDPDSLPTGFGPEEVQSHMRLARAMDTRAPGDIEAAVADQIRSAVSDVRNIPSAAVIFAALGRSDLTFASLDRYFFDRGSFGQPSSIGPYTRRYTEALFTSPMAGARHNPMFASLLRETGLQAYWHQSHTMPDYRRSERAAPA
jgi:DNA-binding winged helix-turn-helix (wHTH) protein/tetratricopeptide (TPR) repeat protein